MRTNSNNYLLHFAFKLRATVHLLRRFHRKAPPSGGCANTNYQTNAKLAKVV